MKVFCIHPGASWATSDVFTGLVAGLQGIPNLDVYQGKLDTILNWYDAAIYLGVQSGQWKKETYETRHFNRQRMASAHITQAILDVWPDVVISVSGHNYHLDDADILRRVGIRTAVILTESPYFGELEGMIAQHYDLAFTNERRSAARLNAVYLPHAYNPAVHTHAGPKAHPADVVFVGSMFDERKELFLSADWSGIDFVWRGHDMSSDLPSGVIPNEEAAALYRSSKIVLNHHRTTTSHGSGQHIRPEDASSVGPRFYEIAACGAFQLVDDSREEAGEILGDTLATYKAGDPDDLTRQVHWWLSHPDERALWAAAQHEAIKPHSWHIRARQVLEYIL